jgi:hypothetical protein
MTETTTPHERAEALMEPLWARGVPRYGEHDDEPEGIYLGLFHGYINDDDREEGGDWGIDGPVIGPLEYVHTTYAAHIKLWFHDSERAKLYFDKERYCDVELYVGMDNCLSFGGVEFGDWTVFYHKPGKQL